MPRNFDLTWHKARKCWKKVFKGRVYYLTTGECKGKTDLDGYKTALTEWQLLRGRLEHGISTGITTGVAFADYRSLTTKVRATSRSTTLATGIRGLIDQYVAMRRDEAQSGQISVAMYSEYKQKLEEFANFADSERLETVDQIDAATLDLYRRCQIDLTKEGANPADAISPVTARKRLARLKTWLEWCHAVEALDRLPRNLKSLARITLEKPRPKFWSVAEVQKLFNSASQRTKLYIALALNCGFTQKDIATLEHGMVDWKEKLLSRDRNKTGELQTAELWPVTLKLLKAEASEAVEAGAGLMLLGENGNPLLNEKIKEDGNAIITDSIRLAFDRLKSKLKLTDDPRGFSIFRKSGANEIAREFEDDRLTDLYLAHASNGMRKHYTETHYKNYFKALAYLGKLYGLKI